MDYITKTIRSNKGAPRIFLDGRQYARAGFAPGTPYQVQISPGESVTLTVCADGSRRVSGRKDSNGEKTIPVMDLNSDLVLEQFKGMDCVRMIIRQGEIIFLPLASEKHKRDRLDRLKKSLFEDGRVSSGSLTHGGGILCRAIHEGLKLGGIECDLQFANEIREDLLEHARSRNDIWSDRTIAAAAPMQELVQDEWFLRQLGKTTLLDMSLPCSGGSVAGRAKLGLGMMEDHPHVGHLVFAALVIIQRVQPALVLLENVTSYANTASAKILRQQMIDMGYDIHEAVVKGSDFGCMENRERWCLVGVTKGLEFSFANITPALVEVRRLGEYLENISLDDPRWSEMRGLKEKQVRDKAAGKNFDMQIFDESSTKINTITKGYAKVRSTDPKIQHPSNPDLLRNLTEVEHARVKGVDPKLIEGLCKTTAHEVLGQGVVYEPFLQIGVAFSETLNKFAEQVIAQKEFEIARKEEGSRRRRMVG